MGVGLALLLGWTMAVPSELVYFPGGYFDSTAKEYLQQRALRSWPSPAGQLEAWRSGELDEDRMVALLLGGAAFHDPVLLEAYTDALGSDSLRVRQAAVYGYRDLIADAVPDVSDGVPADQAARVVGEINALRRTLRRHALIEVWLESAVADEGARSPWRGILFERSVQACLTAVATLAQPGDLPAVVAAYGRAQELQTRLQLMQVAESLALQRFLVMPTGGSGAWTMTVYTDALVRFDAWIATTCWVDDTDAVLSAGMRNLGLEVDAPLARRACGAWARVLKNGEPSWWATAAKQLYQCGAPFVELEVFRAAGGPNRKRREILLGWLNDQRR